MPLCVDVNVDEVLRLLTTIVREEAGSLRLEWRGFGQLDDFDHRAFLAELTHVLALSTQFAQQGAEALQLMTILSSTLGLLGLDVGGGLGRGGRVSFSSVLLQVFIREQQGRSGTFQVPLHIIGQEAHEEVSLDTLFETVMDGSH